MGDYKLDSVAQNRALGQPQVNTDELAQKAASISNWLEAQKAQPSTGPEVTQLTPTQQKKKGVVTELQPQKGPLTGFGSEQRQLGALEKEGY